MDIQAVWHQATESVKDRVIHPTLWRALETAVPVTAEGDLFVVGFAPSSMHLAGHCQSSEHRNAIEAGLAAAAGRRLRLVVIDGTTVNDWQNYQNRQKAAEAARQRARERAEREFATARTWDGVYEQLGRTYASLALRQLPQIRGRFLEQAIEMISEAMDELYSEGSADEPTERSLARIIDRAGTLTEVSPALIALELQRYRAARKS